MSDSGAHDSPDDRAASRLKLWGGVGAAIIIGTAGVLGFLGGFQTRHDAQAQAAEIAARDERQDERIDDSSQRVAVHEAQIAGLRDLIKMQQYGNQLLYDLAVRNGMRPAPIPKPSH